MTSIKTDPYHPLARVYDRLVGVRDELPEIRGIMRRLVPDARSILELGCGTGALLGPLSKEFEVLGLDLSEAMLKVAQQKWPHIPTLQGDMCKFALDRRFDVILCAFNSINHLRYFSDWKRVFQCAAAHLNPGGLFLFDVNTPTGFESLIEESPTVEEDDLSLMITRCRKLKNALEIHMQAFAQTDEELYHLSEGRVLEWAFETSRIKAAAEKHFSKVQLVDPERSRWSTHSDVIYFCCQ